MRSFDLADLLEMLREIEDFDDADYAHYIHVCRLQSDRESLERDLRRSKAIIFSMTPWERHHPGAIYGNRCRRIARGAGQPVEEVTNLLTQFKRLRAGFDV